MLPTSRCSRSASTKLAVASSARFGIGRPPGHHRPALDASSRASRLSGMTGSRSTGPTRRPVPVRPREQQAHARRGRRPSPAGVPRCRRASTAPANLPSRRTNGLLPPTSTSAARCVADELRVGAGGASGTGEQAEDDPASEARDQRDADPGRPTPAQLGSQANEHRRHSCSPPSYVRLAPGQANRAPSGSGARHHMGCSCVATLTAHAPRPTRQDSRYMRSVRERRGARSSWRPRWRSASRWPSRWPRRRRHRRDGHRVEELLGRRGAVAAVRPGPGGQGRADHVPARHRADRGHLRRSSSRAAFDGYGEYQGTLLEFLGGTPSNNSPAHPRGARSEAARATDSS